MGNKTTFKNNGADGNKERWQKWKDRKELVRSAVWCGVSVLSGLALGNAVVGSILFATTKARMELWEKGVLLPLAAVTVATMLKSMFSPVRWTEDTRSYQPLHRFIFPLSAAMLPVGIYAVGRSFQLTSEDMPPFYRPEMYEEWARYMKITSIGMILTPSLLVLSMVMPLHIRDTLKNRDGI